MEKRTLVCDICKDESEKVVARHTMAVVFTTDQDEGRATDPYLDEKKLDIGEKCLGRILSGHMLFATGAMGYYDYFFKET